MDKSEKPWLMTKLIIEIAGFPESHVNDTLKLVSEKFGENVKEIKVRSRVIQDAQKITLDPKKSLEESKFFSGFIEFEADVADLITMVGIIFDWMPASIEVIEPETTIETSANINGFLNDLCARLHQYDSKIKALKAHNVILNRELNLHKPSSDTDGVQK